MKAFHTTNIRSIATMATLPVYDELVLMLRSLALFHPDLPVFILTQPIVRKKLQKETRLPPNRTVVIGLKKYHNKNWRQLEQAETIEFLSQKTTIIDQALRSYPNTLYTDCDMVFAAPIGFVDDSKDLGISLELPENAAINGKYNAGWIFVRNKQFTSWWRNEINKASSPFFVDQISLNGLAESFQIFHFPRNYNLIPQTRFKTVGNPRKEIHFLLKMDAHPSKGIFYKDKPMVNFHSHLCPIIRRGWTIGNCWVMLNLSFGLPLALHWINSNPNNRYYLSSDYLSRHRADFFAFQIARAARLTIKEKISLLWAQYPSRYLFKLIMATRALASYPYYLAREGNHLYHASARLSNRPLSWQTIMISILRYAICEMLFWEMPPNILFRKAFLRRKPIGS